MTLQDNLWKYNPCKTPLIVLRRKNTFILSLSRHHKIHWAQTITCPRRLTSKVLLGKVLEQKNPIRFNVWYMVCLWFYQNLLYKKFPTSSYINLFRAFARSFHIALKIVLASCSCRIWNLPFKNNNISHADDDRVMRITSFGEGNACHL